MPSQSVIILICSCAVNKHFYQQQTEIKPHVQWMKIEMPTRDDKPLLWLSKYLALGLTLPSSAFGGYLVGAFADHYLHMPFLRALGVLLGIGAGLLKIVQELSRDSKKNSSSK